MPAALIALVVLVLVAVGLGVWWWSLRPAADPIDAAPVDAYAVVVSSPACPGDGITKIQIERPGATAAASQVSGCGYRTGARIAVQYLTDHPEQARVATGTATTGSSVRRWLPMGILLAGVLAVAATIVLLAGQRRSRHREAGSDQLTVARLRAGLDTAGPAGQVAPEHLAEAEPPQEPDGNGEADPAPEAADDPSLTIPHEAIEAADPLHRAPEPPADLFTHRGHDLDEKNA